MRVATRAGAAELPGLEIGALRFFGGGLIAFAVARARGASLAVSDQRTAWLRSGFGGLNAAAVFFVLGSPRIAVGDVATLSATGPLFVALFSYRLIRERVPRAVAWGALLGFAGVAVLVKPGFRTAGHLALIVVAGALCYSVAMLSLRRLGPRETSEGIAFHVSLVAGTLLLLLSLPRFAVPSAAVAVPLALSVIAGGLGQLAMSRAYAFEPAARLSAFAYAGVVMTYAFEAIAWRRVPQLHQWVGMALVCLAGLVVVPRRGAAAPARGVARD
jgi:drug/metabolite transporter (DMT)-like permease